LYKPHIAVIKKGKHNPDCEFGAVIDLAKSNDGLILSHVEYEHNIADVRTLGKVRKVSL
jgi:hypothetical protein